MRIGIDISQMAYEKTGVANYLQNLIENLLRIDKENEYILFFSSLRRKFLISNFELLKKSQISSPNFKIKTFRLPQTILDFLWNRLHVLPIEWFVGDVDIFITSDWTEPPTIKAKKVTILYDLIALKYPEETHAKTAFSLKNLIISPNIVVIQKRKLEWVKKESEVIFCISQATKNDAMEILEIEEKRLKVVYPGGVEDWRRI